MLTNPIGTFPAWKCWIFFTEKSKLNVGNLLSTIVYATNEQRPYFVHTLCSQCELHILWSSQSLDSNVCLDSKSFRLKLATGNRQLALFLESNKVLNLIRLKPVSREDGEYLPVSEHWKLQKVDLEFWKKIQRGAWSSISVRDSLNYLHGTMEKCFKFEILISKSRTRKVRIFYINNLF